MSNSVNLALDVTKTGIQNPLIKVRQGDGGFETLRTTVTSNGEPMDLQGWTITFMGTTAGNHKIVDGNVKLVEAPNGIFDYTPSKAWGMDIGEFKIAYFKFVKGDGSASSANFRVNVIEAVDLTQEEAQNYISVVDATIAEAREHIESSLADVSSSVAATSTAASSMAVFVSSAASSAVSQANSATYNVSSVANGAISAVSAASNTYFKNNRKLPDDAHDFSIIASDTIKYQGIWHTDGTAIANGPTANWSWNTVEVLGGFGNGSGIIRTAAFGPNQEYITTVNGSKIMGWKKVADDAQLVHKTGTETIAGDKTFTGNIKFSGKLDTSGANTRGQILDGADLNNYTGNYRYEVNGAKNLVNYPDNAYLWSTLEVEHIGSGAVMQKITDVGNSVFLRTLSGYPATWSSWVKLADDANVTHKTGNETISGDKTFTGNATLSNIKTSSINTGSITANGLKADFREFAAGVEVWFSGSFKGDASFSWHDFGQVPSNITKPFNFVTAVMGGRGGVSGASSQTDVLLMVRIDNTGKMQYQLRHGIENNLTDYTGIVSYVEGSTSYFK